MLISLSVLIFLAAQDLHSSLKSSSGHTVKQKVSTHLVKHHNLHDKASHHECNLKHDKMQAKHFSQVSYHRFKIRYFKC